MRVRKLRRSEIEAARSFLSAHGWKNRFSDKTRFAKLIAKSQRVAVAVKNGQLVGFARAITDGLSNGHISMVLVSAEHRRQRIGRRLFNASSGEARGSPGRCVLGERLKAVLRTTWISPI